MVTDLYLDDAPQVVLRFNRNFVFAAVFFVFGAAALLDMNIQGPSFQAALDTATLLVDALVSLLFWDVSANSGDALAQFISATFATMAVAHLLRAIPMFDLLDGRRDLDLSQLQWRVGGLIPVVYGQIAGLGAALLLWRRTPKHVWLFVLGLVAAIVAFAEIFQYLPVRTYSGFLGISVPALVPAPLLWGAIAIGYWRMRSSTEVSRAISFSAAIFAAASLLMLYSHLEQDSISLAAQLGKLTGSAFLLICLMQIGASDTVRRQVAETKLKALNRDLEDRVSDRTAQLTQANEDLLAAAASRERADTKLRAQYERLKLLDQITRAIAARQDTKSVFQVIANSLESRLPADFVAICQYDYQRHTLTVSNVGAGGMELASALGMSPQSQIEIDENGLSRAVRGQLVYEPDVSAVPFPFPQRLARQNLHALVVIPLIVEARPFGVMIAARYTENAFDSTDCEFLKQLGEHTAIAAHQARLYSNLQDAYEDLRNTQKAVMQQERLRALGQMASGIAHDINNAISPVSLYTETLLESDAATAAPIRSYLTTVKRVIDDVAATVGRLREFYREREPQMPTVPVDLNQIAQQVAELTRARWNDLPQRRGIAISLRCDLDPSLPLVDAVEHEIREALTNLVFNAVDALPEGGAIALRTGICRGTEDRARRVALDVADNGVGMDEATRLRCMEPFFTTKGERGTGLGLAMVYGIANRQKADLEIESAPGAGTTVRLMFTPSAGTRIAAAASRSHKPQRPLKLLVIDDDPAVLESTAVALERDGHEVTKVSGGREGIEAFKAASESGKPYSAVFTDLGMPHMDGTQVAQVIKQLSSKTPVVLLTGWGRRMRADDDVSSNIDYSLGKPPSLKEIREVLVQISSET